MRIRKHAKKAATASVAGAVAATETEKLCLLNQSPWDVIKFSPPHSPCCDDEDAPPPLFSPPPLPSPFEEDYQLRWGFAKWMAGNIVGAGERVKVKNKKVELALCPKTTKKGWKCGAVLKQGNPFCGKHLPKQKKVTSSAAAEEILERRVSSRRSSLSSSKASEYYYYTGFGPMWGKK